MTVKFDAEMIKEILDRWNEDADIQKKVKKEEAFFAKKSVFPPGSHYDLSREERVAILKKLFEAHDNTSSSKDCDKILEEIKAAIHFV